MTLQTGHRLFKGEELDAEMQSISKGPTGPAGPAGPSAANSMAENVIDANVTAVTLTAQSTYYDLKALTWAHDIASKNMTLDTPDKGDIKIVTAGTYFCVATVSWTASAPGTFQFNLFKNNAAVPDHTTKVLAVAGHLSGTCTILGIDSAASLDVYDLRVECTTAAGLTITPTYANASMFMISNQAFGETTVDANATAVTCTAQNTYYDMEGLTWVTDVTQVNVASSAAGNMTIRLSGTYFLAAAISYTASAAGTFRFDLFKNGVVVPDHTVIVQAVAGNLSGSCAIVGVDSAVANDVYDLRVECTSAALLTITPTYVNASVFSIG